MLTARRITDLLHEKYMDRKENDKIWILLVKKDVFLCLKKKIQTKTLSTGTIVHGHKTLI